MNAAEATGLTLAFVARLITGAQGHWKGCPPKAEQRIYFANHQSHFDWVLIWAALPDDLRARTRPIAARDYWQAGRLRHWLTREVFNAVYVDRPGSARKRPAPGDDSAAVPTATAAATATASDTADVADADAGADAGAPAPAPAADARDPLQPLVDALTGGSSLVIFPEGTRGAAAEPAAFKSGLYHLARRFPQVSLVPAWVDNVQRVMPKGEVIPVPLLCTVTFGAPIELGRNEDKRAFLARARDAVVALRPRVP